MICVYHELTICDYTINDSKKSNYVGKGGITWYIRIKIFFMVVYDKEEKFKEIIKPKFCGFN